MKPKLPGGVRVRDLSLVETTLSVAYDWLVGIGGGDSPSPGDRSAGQTSDRWRKTMVVRRRKALISMRRIFFTQTSLASTHGGRLALLWAGDYERDLTDVLKLQSDVARAVAGEIRIQVTPEEEARFTSARSVNPQAHEAYLLGRYHYSKDNEQ
ncbi:MAG: hypothetical protein ACREBG_13945 [Pyrinomonadaceae bacterium]